MFRPVGEVFEDSGLRLKVVEVKTCFCDGCYYQSNSCGLLFAVTTPEQISGECSAKHRGDEKNVIFQREEQ